MAVQIITETKRKYPTLTSCGFDKNFYSPENKKRLSAILETAALPKKGKLSQAQKQEASQGKFVAARKQHPAIESGIHALENHGLDRCLDYGIQGFQRYVSLAIVGRNVQVLGAILWKQEEQTKRKKKTAPV